MNDVDSQIAMIQSRLDTARLAKARAAVTKETAEATSNRVMQQLIDEFGVDNLPDARAKLAELHSQLQDEMQKIATVLDQIEL